MITLRIALRNYKDFGNALEEEARLFEEAEAFAMKVSMSHPSSPTGWPKACIRVYAKICSRRRANGRSRIGHGILPQSLMPS